MTGILPETLFPASLSDAEIKEIQISVEGFYRPEHRDRRLVFKNPTKPDEYVAILEKDLDVWKDVVAMAAGLSAVVPNYVAIIGSLVLLLYRFRRLNVRLNGMQGLALLHLRTFGPAGCTEVQLLEAMKVKEEGRTAALTAIEELTRTVATNNELKPLLNRQGDHLRAAAV